MTRNLQIDKNKQVIRRIDLPGDVNRVCKAELHKLTSTRKKDVTKKEERLITTRVAIYFKSEASVD